MKKYILYFSQSCYFCQKVLFAIKGKDHQIELRSTSDSDHLQELYIGGGMTQVPCLKIDTVGDEPAIWLYESDDIIQYITSEKLVS